MAQNVNPTFVKSPNAGIARISNTSSASSIVTVYTGGTNGSKVNSLVAAAVNTTAAFDIQWGIQSGSTIGLIGTSSVPIGAGQVSSVPSVNLFNMNSCPGLSLDSDGNPYCFLPSTGWSLFVSVTASSTLWAAGAAVIVTITSAGDF